MKKNILIIFLFIATSSFSQVNKDSLNQVNSEKEKVSLTLGTFQSGQSWFGFDLEVLLLDQFGIQGGFSHFGLGGGINYHIKNDIKSPFISLQYWQQGANDRFVKSVMGLSYVYRSKGKLTGQLGLGKTIKTAATQVAINDEPDIHLLFSIGLYFTR